MVNRKATLRKLTRIFHGGPWDGEKTTGILPRQIHTIYELPHGTYVRTKARDTATERHYVWQDYD